MRVSWIWWFQPVRDRIRLQLQWPDRQWGYDHLNRYSQSPMIRSSISSLDLSTLLHSIRWKCNRSILAGWLVQIPASQRRRSRTVLMQRMQISPAFVLRSWCRSQGDVNSPALSLEHQGPSAPSDPRLSAALWAPRSEMHVHILCAMQQLSELFCWKSPKKSINKKN